MNAAVGPPICTREPPSAETTTPAMTAVNSPMAGGVSQGWIAASSAAVLSGMLAIPRAIASGRAMTATVSPAPRSAKNRDLA